MWGGCDGDVWGVDVMGMCGGGCDGDVCGEDVMGTCGGRM